MEIDDLPSLNAFFNLCATLCLWMGYRAIKKKETKIHQRWMVSALVFSAFFLFFYLLYHYHAGSKIFPDLGWIKTLYLMILIPHILLAAVMLPLIICTFYFAFTGNYLRHRKWARITFPIWMYVSVTGVVIYLMLYQFFG